MGSVDPGSAEPTAEGLGTTAGRLASGSGNRAGTSYGHGNAVLGIEGQSLGSRRAGAESLDGCLRTTLSERAVVGFLNLKVEGQLDLR